MPDLAAAYHYLSLKGETVMHLEDLIAKNNELLTWNNMLLERLEKTLAAMKNSEAVEPSAAPAPAPDPDPATTPAPTEEKTALTITQVRAHVVKLKDDKGAPAVLRLLERYGAAKVSDVKPDDYARLIADINDILNVSEEAA